VEGELRDVVVIGAGIAGLAAAWDLRNRDIVVLEAADRIGGRIRSERRGDYWLNVGAHVWAGAGSASGRLIADTGVEAVEVPGTLMAMELGGKKVTSGRVETFPIRLPMSNRDRAALMRIGPKIRLAVERYKRATAPRLDEDPRETRMRTMQFLGDQTFEDWLGPVPEGVDKLFRPTVTRSTGDPEELMAGQGVGYFALVWSSGGGLSRNIIGGSQALIDAIAAELGDRVRTGCAVTSVADEGEHVVITHAGGTIHARHCIIATLADQAADLAPGLPAETLDVLRRIPYGEMVVMAILTDETGPEDWDSLYALATPDRPFNMIFNMANVLRPRSPVRAPGGSLMVYRSGSTAIPLLEMDDAETERTFLEALHDVYPSTRGHIAETLLLKIPRCIPFPKPGRWRMQAALERDMGRIRLAGDYMGTAYTESSVASGQEAALAVRRALQNEGVPVRST
jgi:protoporphyrinogen/coproporphyrinogen III oxidase